MLKAKKYLKFQTKRVKSIKTQTIAQTQAHCKGSLRQSDLILRIRLQLNIKLLNLLSPT